MKDLIYSLANLDTRTMVAVLFFGNICSGLLIFLYVLIYRKPSLISKNNVSKTVFLYSGPIRNLGVARMLQAVCFLLIFARGMLCDFLTINVGLTIGLIGFYTEIMLIFELTAFNNKHIIKGEKIIIIIALILFNICELLNILSPANRVIFISVIMFIIFLAPTVNLIIAKSIDIFDRTIVIFYGLMVISFIPRIVYFAQNNDQTDVFAPSCVQTFTHLSMIMIMIFTLTLYMLLFSKMALRAVASRANLDYLTELPNRHSFLADSENAISEHRATGKSFCLLFIDIDKFKRINDTYGHGFGDEVLVNFSNILSESLGKEDYCCRYGGEEFLVLLNEAGVDEGKIFAEKLMQEISFKKFHKKPELKYTISIGIAVFDANQDKSLNSYIDMADKALYYSKQTGRNKVSVYGIDIHG